MFEVGIKTHFSAAHSLRGYPGVCANRHGHNWEVEVFVQGRKLNKTGILMDFREMKDMIREVLAGFDHTDLNEHKAFLTENPTSEGIARHIHQKLSGLVRAAGCRVSRVTVQETPGSTASYWEK